jgi:hypothetical protein
MTNVPPATPPQATGAIKSSPNSQEGLSQQQQNAGQRSGGGQVPKEVAAPPSSPAVTIAASLAGLREGMRFKGTMMGSDANGLPVIRTPNGTFILSQALEQLALNGEVDIEIRVAGTKITALLMSIAGKPQHPPKEVSLTMTSVSGDNLSGKTLAGGLAAGLSPRGGQAATFNIGTQLTANVLNTPAIAIPGSPLEAGGTLILKISQVALALPKSDAPLPPGAAPNPAQSSSAPVATTTQAGPTNLVNDIKSQLAASQTSTTPNHGVLSGNANRLAETTVQSAPIASSVSSGTAAPSATTPPAAATAQSAVAPGATPSTTATSPSASQAQATNSAVIASGSSAPPPAAAATSPPPTLSAAISQTALLSQQDTELLTLSKSAVPSVARSIQGEVIGPHRDGGLLVRTPLGDISLLTRAVLPQGSRLTFDTVAARAPESVQRPIPQGQIAPMEGGVIAPETMAAVKSFAREWPALKEVMAALQSVNPTAAQNLVASTMPGANTNLASSILLFLNALRGGDMKGWLGNEATAILERGGHDDLLNRLTSDAAQMGRASETPGQGDWRALPFPLFDGSDLQQIWAFVREHRRAGDQADKKALRFVVELELTALGGMQMDGLIQDKQFDLIVRNSRPLPVDVRQGIKGLFESSVEATGFGGSIIFQSDTTWPVSPFREAQQEAAGHGEIVA